MKNPAGLLIVVVLVLVVYSLMYLPQRRQQKNRQSMLKQLAPGARILTAGGMRATVLSVRNDAIVARVGLGDGLDVEFDHRAVLRVLEPASMPEPAVVEAESGKVDQES